MSTEVRGRLRGILQQDSLQVNQYLKLSFQERGDEVARDRRSKVFQLPPETNIVEVFEREEVARRLLILGEPGAGKTTNLLKLAAELVAQAKEDSTAQIPVIFELSAWKKDNQSIEQWLVEQLKDLYSIDFKISQRWIKQNRILPLLDGLDELGLIRQRMAIEKINQYLQQDIDRQLVVCCRWEEYKEGDVKLYKLQGAYYLQAPTESDIRDYLERLNQQDLWQKIKINPEMRQLAQKPLFLNLMVTAFQGETIFSEEQLFSSYVSEQLRRPLDRQKYPQGKAPYSDDDTKKWLTYLAGQLEADKLTVFLIEKMQPYWLNLGWERLVFRLIYGLISGLILGLISGLILGLFWLIVGLISRLVLGLNAEIKYREKPNQGIKESLKKTLIISLISSLFCLSILQFYFRLLGESFDWSVSVDLSLLLGCFVALFTGGQDLIQHLTLRLILEQQKLVPRNYAHFLEYAKERKFIHKIGGQYRFLHDSLRKYFASQAPIPKRVM